MKKTKGLILIIFFIVLVCMLPVPVLGWSNGGYSADFENPDYGTHDWIAEHAMNMLPETQKSYLELYFNAYLLGTEAPDNAGLNYKTYEDYGDTTKHHNYYDLTGNIIEDDAAERAKEEYDKALSALKSNNYEAAAYYAGSMTHYIADPGHFGHVMGSGTPWGREDSNKHSESESKLTNSMTSFNSPKWDFYIIYDGSLVERTAYEASNILGSFNCYDDGGEYNCTWQNATYDDTWSNVDDWSIEFHNRTGEILNYCVNLIADVLYKLAIEGAVTTPPVPGFEIIFILLPIFGVAFLVYCKKRQKINKI